MNVWLRNKVKWFLRYADKASCEIVNALMKEIDRIEQERVNEQKRYEQRLDEASKRAWEWEQRFYSYFYPNEDGTPSE